MAWCFAHFKGLLKVQLPLKDLLPLARLPSWRGCITGLPWHRARQASLLTWRRPARKLQALLFPLALTRLVATGADMMTILLELPLMARSSPKYNLPFPSTVPHVLNGSRPGSS